MYYCSKYKLTIPWAFYHLTVPMYDIDLIWHTHQLHPHSYARDMADFLGYLLHHNDKETDRSRQSRLAAAETSTRMLWRDTYGEILELPGTIYRGEPPLGRLHKVSYTYLWYQRTYMWVGACMEAVIRAMMRRVRCREQRVRGEQRTWGESKRVGAGRNVHKLKQGARAHITPWQPQ